ncbi:hypothetical protein CBL_06147 [Carabus blaptoides fortunei]
MSAYVDAVTVCVQPAAMVQAHLRIRQLSDAYVTFNNSLGRLLTGGLPSAPKRMARPKLTAVVTDRAKCGMRTGRTRTDNGQSCYVRLGVRMDFGSRKQEVNLQLHVDISVGSRAEFPVDRKHKKRPQLLVGPTTAEWRIYLPFGH